MGPPYFTISLFSLPKVMVSTSGDQLLPQAAISNLRSMLLPITTVLTPNIPEAKMLLSDAGENPKDPQNLEDMIDLAKAVHKLGPKYVLLKGGHIPLTRQHQAAPDGKGAELVVDILFDGSEVMLVATEYLRSKNTHGTGCSLASAIASNLVQGFGVPRAVRAASRYVEAGIKTSSDIGKGSGPINHFHSSFSLPFAPCVRSDIRDVMTLTFEQRSLSRVCLRQTRCQGCVERLHGA
jgi:hydroxymethylpyrimidine kinase/phosphomethylpyrimidine kinase